MANISRNKKKVLQNGEDTYQTSLLFEIL